MRGVFVGFLNHNIAVVCIFKNTSIRQNYANLCWLLEYLLIKVFGFLWESDLGRSYETRVFLFTNPLKFESKSEES